VYLNKRRCHFPLMRQNALHVILQCCCSLFTLHRWYFVKTLFKNILSLLADWTLSKKYILEKNTLDDQSHNDRKSNFSNLLFRWPQLSKIRAVCNWIAESTAITALNDFSGTFEAKQNRGLGVQGHKRCFHKTWLLLVHPQSWKQPFQVLASAVFEQ